MKLRLVLAVLIAAAAAADPAAAAADAHAHGVARLDVAVDSGTITLQLASPLEALVGFERAPRNDAERGQVGAMAQTLRSGRQFAPTAAARCRLDRVELHSSVLAPELLGAGGTASANRPPDDHAELEGTFVYRCDDPGALQGIDVVLFDYFKRLRRVDVQVVGPKGQSALRLTSGSRQIRGLR